MALLKTEGVEIDFASDAIARIAVHVNPTIENIGVLRFQTVMEQVQDEVNFLVPDRTGERITIDGVFVETNVGDLAKNTDFSRFIL